MSAATSVTSKYLAISSGGDAATNRPHMGVRVAASLGPDGVRQVPVARGFSTYETAGAMVSTGWLSVMVNDSARPVIARIRVSVVEGRLIEAEPSGPTRSATSFKARRP